VGYGDRIRLFLSFAGDSKIDEVPDPYYGGDDGFEHVLDLVENASEGLLAEIRAGA
jgi:protein-tyrosine phosphatase